MKVYISLPITGHPLKDVEHRIERAKEVLRGLGHEPVSPLDVSDNPDATYAEHMGRDITALLECDAILFLEGWKASKGCRLEHTAAEIYGKRIIHGIDLLI